jgi:hypothetical protein
MIGWPFIIQKFFHLNCFNLVLGELLKLFLSFKHFLYTKSSPLSHIKIHELLQPVTFPSPH